MSSKDSSPATTDRLASLAHETVDRAAPTVARVEREARDATARIAEGAEEIRADAVAATEEGVRSMRSYIESNPLTMLVIAFAAGALLSSVVRR